jgi:hypothetical protein
MNLLNNWVEWIGFRCGVDLLGRDKFFYFNYINIYNQWYCVMHIELKLQEYELI